MMRSPAPPSRVDARRIGPRLLLGLAALCSAAAMAQTTLHYREGQRIDPQDVQRILSNDAPRATTRSIRLLGDESVGPAAATAADALPASALSLPVQFEFDSVVILPEARDQLDALAEGIKLLPAERRVVIEGHTDASGSDAYNHQLSLRRAAAVKHYLTHRHGIDPRRLRDTGLGKRQPIAGLDPFAPEHRRVQFRGGG
jgi:outer membrane protein OmpA-like peptidoglycan-associated protein